MVYVIDTENVSSKFWMNLVREGKYVHLFISSKSKPLKLLDIEEVVQQIENGNISIIHANDNKKNIMDTEILCYVTSMLSLINSEEYCIVSNDSIYKNVSEFMKNELGNSKFDRVSFLRPMDCNDEDNEEEKKFFTTMAPVVIDKFDDPLFECIDDNVMHTTLDDVINKITAIYSESSDLVNIDKAKYTKLMDECPVMDRTYINMALILQLMYNVKLTISPCNVNVKAILLRRVFFKMERSILKEIPINIGIEDLIKPD